MGGPVMQVLKTPPPPTPTLIGLRIILVYFQEKYALSIDVFHIPHISLIFTLSVLSFIFF
jgi:hypothetical protein